MTTTSLSPERIWKTWVSHEGAVGGGGEDPRRNVGTAVKRSDDKRRGDGWLLGEKCESEEPKGDLVVLCNLGSVERERSTFLLEGSTVFLDLCPVGDVSIPLTH